MHKSLNTKLIKFLMLLKILLLCEFFLDKIVSNYRYHYLLY